MHISSLQFPSEKGYFLIGLDSFYTLEGRLGKSTCQSIAQTILHVTQPHISGLLLDPVLTFPHVKIPSVFPVGLGLRLERWAAEEPTAIPTLEPDWGVEAVRQNAAVAKLSLWYHPLEENAVLKKQFLTEIHDYCRHLGIELLLELQFFDVANSPLHQSEVVLRAVEDIRGLAEMVALPGIGDSLTAATVTAELDIPWLVSLGTKDSEFMEYEAMKEQLRQALESGAAGCLVGQSLWQEIFGLIDEAGVLNGQAAANFISTTLRDRVIETSRLIKEAVS